MRRRRYRFFAINCGCRDLPPIAPSRRLRRRSASPTIQRFLGIDSVVATLINYQGVALEIDNKLDSWREKRMNGHHMTIPSS